MNITPKNNETNNANPSITKCINCPLVKQHIDIYDIAKGIGIILIIIGHLHCFFAYDSDIYIFIYNFHVPLFIVLSGCVFKSESITFSEYFHKRFNSIIVPYVFAAVLSILYATPLQEGYSQNLDSILMGTTYNGNLTFNVPLWYCPMIFMACIIFYSFNSLSSKVPNKELCLILLITFSTVCGYILVTKGIRLPWNIETSLIAQIYLYIGFKLKALIKNYYDPKCYLYFLGSLLIACSMYSFTYKLNGRVDMNGGYYNNLLLYAINSFLGISIVLLASIILRRIPVIWKLLSYIGKNSLYIMLFHRLSTSFVQGQITNYMPDFISNNLWKANAISVSYWVIMSILFSLFWGRVYCTITKIQKPKF